MKLYGWKFILFQPVHKNGVFSHNCEREVIVDSRSNLNEPKAPALRPGYFLPEICMTVSDEFVYSVYCLGAKKRIITYEYEKE